MLKRIGLVLLVFLLLAGCAAAEQIDNMMVSNCDSWVSLRKAADTDSSRIMKVSRGEYVYAQKAVGDFWYCEYNGRWGYILGAYLCVVDGAQFDGGREMVVANCESWVSLRSTADTSSPRLREVSLGDAVTAYDRVGEFTLCNHRGKWGYILTKYLKNKSGGGVQNNQSAGVMYVANCEEWVSLRSSASTSASRLAKVPLGAQVETFGRTGQFTQCRYNGKTGYILTKYLSGVKPGAAAPMGTIAPVATAQPKYLGPMYVVNCEQIALRKNADMLSEVVGYVPLGGRVEAYEYNAMFYQCWYNGVMSGYIPKNYLSMVPPATFAPIGTIAPMATPVPTAMPAMTLPPLTIPVIGGTPTPEPTEEPSVYIGTRFVSVNAKTVAMYAEPSLEAPVIAEIENGVALEVYSCDEQFVKLTVDGVEGYVVASALSEEPPKVNWFARFIEWLISLFSF